MSRVVLFALLVVTAAPAGARAQDGPPPAPIAAECSPIATAWYIPPGATEPVSGPNLAVVDTDLRPDHTRLYLDGRFIGLADDFDGYPDYLYLQAGQYLLEGRLGGYRTVAFAVSAEPGCAFQLRYRLERVSGTAKEHWWDEPAEMGPGVRLFGPAQPPSAPAAVASGPDLALRSDLGRTGGGEVRPGLRFAVAPLEAVVYLDGVFVGQAVELNRRSRPLPVPAGRHRLEAMAPGHVTHQRELEVAPDQVLEVVVALQRE